MPVDELPPRPPLYEPPRVGYGLPSSRFPEPEPDDAGRDRSGLGIRAAIIGGIVGAVVAVLVAGGLFLVFDDDPTTSPPEQSASAPSPSGGGSIGTPPASGSLDIQALLAKAQPSVVSIETDAETVRGIFGGAGSGVVISEDGLVLTNAHVIAGADTVTVVLSDGTRHDAVLVGSEPDRDIALVQVNDVSGLTPAELGSSSDLQVGDDVVAIGNALGLGGTPSVTRGIVSALDRAIDAPPVQLQDLIQTDAAINPGNSGGALLNAQGQLVGIPTAIIDQAENIGFAISIDSIKPLIEELKAGGGTISPDGPFLGVSSQSLDGLTPEEIDEYDIEVDAGAFVLSIVDGSAAQEAGLEPGDVITAIDGQPVASADDVGEIILQHEPGDQIEITYERHGEERRGTTTLTTREEAGD
jgi:putative serine protease PepD